MNKIYMVTLYSNGTSDVRKSTAERIAQCPDPEHTNQNGWRCYIKAQTPYDAELRAWELYEARG